MFTLETDLCICFWKTRVGTPEDTNFIYRVSGEPVPKSHGVFFAVYLWKLAVPCFIYNIPHIIIYILLNRQAESIFGIHHSGYIYILVYCMMVDAIIYI